MPNREISEEHWRLSFERYFGNGWACGYCKDARLRHEWQGYPCDSCLISKNICSYKYIDKNNSNDYIFTGYYGKMFYATTKKTSLKYKNLIRTYIIDEGRRLGYSTPDDEKVVREVGK